MQLERELAALRAGTRSLDADADYVRNMLCDKILDVTRVRAWKESRPFGSTIAREALAEVELPGSVSIDVDDVETLLRRVRLQLAKGGARFRATARLRADDGSQVVYAVAGE
jgi:hypothetical protein